MHGIILEESERPLSLSTGLKNLRDLSSRIERRSRRHGYQPLRPSGISQRCTTKRLPRPIADRLLIHVRPNPPGALQIPEEGRLPINSQNQNERKVLEVRHRQGPTPDDEMETDWSSLPFRSPNPSLNSNMESDLANPFDRPSAAPTLGHFLVDQIAICE
jgi:hypothetical protein